MRYSVLSISSNMMCDVANCTPHSVLAVCGGCSRKSRASEWNTDGTRTAKYSSTACFTLFNQGPDAAAQLAALTKASSYQRSDMIVKGGWVTMPGSTAPVRGAAD